MLRYSIKDLDGLRRVKILYEDIIYGSPINYKYISRYAKTRTITNQGLPFHEITVSKEIPESLTDKYITVSNIQQNRLDLISYEYYGSAIYWWYIAETNNIIDPFDIPRGTTLRIPPLSNMYVKGGILDD